MRCCSAWWIWWCWRFFTSAVLRCTCGPALQSNGGIPAKLWPIRCGREELDPLYLPEAWCMEEKHAWQNCGVMIFPQRMIERCARQVQPKGFKQETSGLAFIAEASRVCFLSNWLITLAAFLAAGTRCTLSTRPWPHVIVGAQMDGVSEKLYSTTFRPLQRILDVRFLKPWFGLIWRPFSQEIHGNPLETGESTGNMWRFP